MQNSGPYALFEVPVSSKTYLRIVVGDGEITLKTTNLPTALQLAKFAESLEKMGIKAKVNAYNDGWLFVRIPLEAPVKETK